MTRALEKVQLARLTGEVIEALSFLREIEIVRGPVGEEERARSDPPDKMLNREAKQLLARMAGDRESITGVLVKLCLDVVPSGTTEGHKIERGISVERPYWRRSTRSRSSRSMSAAHEVSSWSARVVR